MESFLGLTVSGQIVVLTGPPGAGKSSVGGILAEKFPLSAHLVADTFWGFLRSGRIPPHFPQAHRQNGVVTDVVAEAACGYARGGYSVVYDGVLGPWFLTTLVEKCARQDDRRGTVALHYVVLRPDEETTVRRARARTGEHALTDPGPVRSLHRQFLDLGPLEPHVVDSSALTAEETATLVYDGIGRGAYLLRR